MNHKYITVLTLASFGAASAFAQITLNPVPSRAIGTPALNISTLSPNLVEGREFNGPLGIAVDTSVSPPTLYVADTLNNRVLAWKNASTFTSGQKADLAIGQPDLATTFAAGPGTTYSTGLRYPTGVAAYKGDLYVVDTGNNRVLRYRTPFLQVQSQQFPTPDLEIGQASVVGRNPNYTGVVNGQGIFLSNSSQVLTANIAFDSQGNLWMTDPGNARVLRFKATDVAAGGGGLTADLEIGQLDLNSTQPALPNNSTGAQVKNQFALPSALGFDANGNLFVTDSTGANAPINRVLVFSPPFSSGMAASRLMGVFPPNYTFPTTQSALQALTDVTLLFNPEGIFFLTGATGVGVIDQGSSRIMIFDDYSKWPTDGSPPQAKLIFGQPATCAQFPNQSCKAPNNGTVRPAANYVATPGAAVFTGSDLYVADSGNNRVLDLPWNGTLLGAATRVLGQDRFDTGSVDLIEGREFQFQNAAGSGQSTDAAIVIDSSGSVPHVYISDPGNNRVLGFKDIRNLTPGAKADIVLGQPDMQTSIANYPSGDPNKPTSSSLSRPIGLAVDTKGNLFVADSLNGRVLRFPAPFSYQGAAPEPADVVLGKSNFTTANFPDPTNTNMYVPYGLAFSGTNGLLVSDQADSRVLYFPLTNGTFTAGTDNGKAATIVFGQASFNTTTTGTDQAHMNNPHHLACDSNGFVYVADSGNNRILIFNDPHASGTPPTGESATVFIGGLNSPQGIFVSQVTGEIWVANTGAYNAVRYANYNSVALGNGSISAIQEVSSNYLLAPLAVVQDQFGALYIADNADRVAFYFPNLTALNGANFHPTRPLAPGMIASIFSCTNCSPTQYGTDIVSLSKYPMPPMLADVSVLFNGVATPLYFVSPTQINFVVPNGAPTSGTADVEVVQVSTGQVLGASLIQMQPASPGLFLYPGGQLGPNRAVATINQDNTVNTATNAAPLGTTISLYATGEGNVPGAPPDGTPPTGPVNAPEAITVFLGGIDIHDPVYKGGAIYYSGLNGFPGVWQINITLPSSGLPPSSQTGGVTPIAVVVNGVVNYDVNQGWKTIIYVK